MPVEKFQNEKNLGSSALAEVLGDIQFPITRGDLLQQYGQTQIQWTPGTRETLENLLMNTTQEQFYSITDVVSAISQPA
jgi:hypothetical protein